MSIFLSLSFFMNQNHHKAQFQHRSIRSHAPQCHNHRLVFNAAWVEDDVPFSVPKSVSLVDVIMNDSRIQAAHSASVATARKVFTRLTQEGK